MSNTKMQDENNDTKKVKKEKKEKKRKKHHKRDDNNNDGSAVKKKKKEMKQASSSSPAYCSNTNELKQGAPRPVTFDIKHIMAPMVGASELAFRLLCRKYGTTTCYTPMMSSVQFVASKEYRQTEFQTVKYDRPLVAHFSANDPKVFAAAAKLVESQCDAIDLNLGCPQRTAFLGHFGSYLLQAKDRDLVCSLVRSASAAVTIPIFVKIRLLDTLEETIELCQQLRDAGASLIAIHARYRATWDRKGPGARDGPALLEQVTAIKKIITDIPIIANGNIITYDDVVKNLKLTNADGVMSAEGILDNPALYLPSIGADNDDSVKVKIEEPILLDSHGNRFSTNKKVEEIKLKLLKISKIEQKIKERNNGSEKSLKDGEEKKLDKKGKLLKRLAKYEKQVTEKKNLEDEDNNSSVPLTELYSNANDCLKLAREYIALTKTYPVKMRSIIFHVRRMCRNILNEYQLMADCVNAKDCNEIEGILAKCDLYRSNPQSFHFDKRKADQEKEALARRKAEEGKRKAYEARMIRKAKREGKSDLEFYLNVGAEVPTAMFVEELKSKTREEQLTAWKMKHSQHCMNFHLGEKGCLRDRACAFLHAEAKGENTFNEIEEAAG